MDASRYAAGFQDLLGTNSRGEGVRQSADFMQPALDVRNLLGAPRLEGVSVTILGSVSGTANNFNLAFTVPTGEVWLLRSFNAWSNFTGWVAGDQIWDAEVAILPRTGSRCIVYDRPQKTLNRAGFSTIASWVAPRDIYLLAGSTIGCTFYWATPTLGLAADFDARVMIERLRA